MSQLPVLQISESGQPERLVELRGTATVGRDSTNGTWLNGKPTLADDAVLLADGDTITLGRMVARYHATPAEGHV
jgi:pSer/pThr/pTyr-binding forkhead associated (FHA) protein